MQTAPRPSGRLAARARRAALAAALPLAAIAVASVALALQRGDAAPADTAVELPPRWFSSGLYGFERAARELAGAPRLSEAALAELEAGLAAGWPASTRAAVLLARAADPRAAEVLLRRLEARVPAPERNADAGDCTAAAGLAGFADVAGVPERLEALAVGGAPHPDLEVRVECARAAVGLGRDGSLGLLLSVLRIGTPTGRAEGVFWPAPRTSAWARGRAAEVLSWRAGVPCGYRTDGSLEHREAAADALETALRVAGALSSAARADGPR